MQNNLVVFTGTVVCGIICLEVFQLFCVLKGRGRLRFTLLLLCSRSGSELSCYGMLKCYDFTPIFVSGSSLDT